jgi:sterol desaturase/sphingolipid hydroxylase (fatty acid hydroxylase superfamily)
VAPKDPTVSIGGEGVREMRLTKVGYYQDFVLYPAAIVVLAGAALWTPALEQSSIWAFVFIGALALWTLLEYLLHRLVFHHVPFIRALHEAHHNDQKGLIGPPTWLTASLFAGGVFAPVLVLSNFTAASAFTSGLMLGYLWYASIHHILHRWRSGPGAFGQRLRRRHLLHHHFDEHGNFGVTSGLWDRVFGTDINPRLVRSASRLTGSTVAR